MGVEGHDPLSHTPRYLDLTLNRDGLNRSLDLNSIVDQPNIEKCSRIIFIGIVC